MTTHELARQLLEQPDVPVNVQVNTSDDGFWSAPGVVALHQDTSDLITLFAYATEGENTEP